MLQNPVRDDEREKKRHLSASPRRLLSIVKPPIDEFSCERKNYVFFCTRYCTSAKISALFARIVLLFMWLRRQAKVVNVDPCGMYISFISNDRSV